MTKRKDKNDLKKAGRKTVMTPEIISKLEYAFALGCSDLEACYYADIGSSTLYNYLKANPEFMERKHILKERPMFKARTAVMQAITDGDVATARWYLERKGKDEFSAKLETTGDFTAIQKVYITEEEDKKVQEHINKMIEKE